MKRLIFVLAVIALLVPMVAYAWNGGVSATPSCDGATVAASPSNYPGPHFGGLLRTWKPYSNDAPGFVPWGEATSLNGSVTVVWHLYGNLTGHDYSVGKLGYKAPYSESFSWSANKPAEGCQPPPDMCEYNQTIKADDPLCVPPPPPPIEPECEWKGTGTAVFELWSGPDYTGDYATMYVYDFGDGYPEGVSVQRQSCVLGWVAQTDTGVGD